ncbi:hypothetical protein FOYG_03688 [Fusarium oxysporum NRRL 32931]|uniref:Uncharacterized protein n=1 Tax=Fusarium oxysporum NRRL 32931 TaxID=660029 RepID=W9J4J6_FUSOX|nr:hypothetical protein FOYG_03688 [Fusarium oxysporum NRRL 32931]
MQGRHHLSQSQQDTDLPGLFSDIYLFKPRAQDSRPGPEPLGLFFDRAVIKILLSSVPNWCTSVTGCSLALMESGSEVLFLLGNRCQGNNADVTFVSLFSQIAISLRLRSSCVLTHPC